MNRAQRTRHRLMWWVLAPVLILAVIVAVIGRQHYPPQAAPATTGDRP